MNTLSVVVLGFVMVLTGMMWGLFLGFHIAMTEPKPRREVWPRIVSRIRRMVS